MSCKRTQRGRPCFAEWRICLSRPVDLLSRGAPLHRPPAKRTCNVEQVGNEDPFCFGIGGHGGANVADKVLFHGDVHDGGANYFAGGIRETSPKNFQATIEKFADSVSALKPMLKQVMFL